MRIATHPLHPVFAAELAGLDLASTLGPDTRDIIDTAMARHAVVVLRNQRLDDARQIAFASLFGPLELAPMIRGKTNDGGRRKRIEHPNIFDVSNLDEEGKLIEEDDERRLYRRGNELWHTDSSFRQKSATYSMLHARIVPPKGADTEFVDTRAAYDALPEAMKAKLEGLVAEHSIWHSRGKLGGYTPSDEERKLRPPAYHPLVRTHPVSGRKSLYIASHAAQVMGWPQEEGRAFLADLIERATRPELVYRHSWRPGDLVIWDNRTTMHRATPFEDTVHIRDLRRTTVIDVQAAMAA